MFKLKFLLIFICFLCVGCSDVSDYEYGDTEYDSSKKEVNEVKVSILEPTISYSCNNSYGEYLFGNKCIYYLEFPAIRDYECPYGYTSYGSSCRYRLGRIDHRCSSNAVYYNGYCYRNVQATITYKCSVGYLVNDKCRSEYSYDAIINYECPYGYSLVNNKCYKYN